MGHDQWTASRRFGVEQGTKIGEDGSPEPKIRQIDDLSEYFVNACVTIDEKVLVHGIDAIAGVATLWVHLTLTIRPVTT